MNQKGDLTDWTWVILFIVLFITVLGFMVNDLNASYGTSLSLPLAEKVNQSVLIKFNNYIGNATEDIEKGQINFLTVAGFILESSWGFIKELFTILVQIFTGGWIQDLAGQLELGEAGTVLGTVLRILFVMGLVRFIVYILFKV